jgi:hypothetical protein
MLPSSSSNSVDFQWLSSADKSSGLEQTRSIPISGKVLSPPPPSVARAERKHLRGITSSKMTPERRGRVWNAVWGDKSEHTV